jgi:hypothetical protein
MKPYLLTSFYYDLLPTELRDVCYNGMGAEWMPDWSRDVLDFVFDVLEDAVRGHDVDFCHHNKTESWFHESNKRMRVNMIRLAKREIPWWRYFKRRRFLNVWIPAMFFAVENGGWRAFTEATLPDLQPQPC